MLRYLSLVMVGFTLAIAGCATDQSKGPTYPVVGTVSQKEMEKRTDQARATFAILATATAQYVALPRCVANGPTICSNQAYVNEARRYANAADVLTAGAAKIARDPTKTAVEVANAYNDAQRALEVLRATVAKFNAKAAQEA